MRKKDLKKDCLDSKKIKTIDLSKINNELDELSNILKIIKSKELLLKKYNVNIIVEIKL